jgi:transposase
MCSGVKGRARLAGLELPLEEAETVAACLRHVEFLDSEIAAVEREIARQALESPALRRLLTVPGVNVICAATFLAAVGDIRRFPTSRKLVGYLGLDPRVFQSGSSPAKGGRISKQGSPAARWALVEAAWSAVQQPGPLRAFYQRIRGRRGGKIAVVAVARKLAALFWSLLSRGEDYAHQQPSLTAQKLRRLEITAGAPVRNGKPSGVWVTHEKMRQAEKQLAAQAQASYERTVRDWQAGKARKAGASVTAEPHRSGPRRAPRAADPRAPDACSSTRHRLAPTRQPSAAHPTSTTTTMTTRAQNPPKSPDRDRRPPNRPHRTRI